MAVNNTPVTLDSPVKFIKGVGIARAEAFARLGISTVADLLAFFPRSYEERGRIVKIEDAEDGEVCSLSVTVSETYAPRHIKGGRTMFRSLARDDTGSITLVFFNTPFMAKTLVHGRRFRVYGRVKAGLYGKEMVSPKLEPMAPGVKLPEFVPVYRVTPPLTSKTVAATVAEVLPLCESMPDVLTPQIISSNRLMRRGEAVAQLHAPTCAEKLGIAKRTLAFESLAVFRLALSGMRNEINVEKAVPLGLKGAGVKRFFENLPFELTSAQQRAVKEIYSDLEKPVPMARLLQGDVGSGKTAVAAAAIYLCVKNGYQACMMAPTEILASQHKKTLDKFLAPFGIKTALLVSGLPAAEKRAVRESIAAGETDVAIGTHALITDDTVFANCALAVTDEQHRFGVAQRAKLLDKSERDGRRAHMLVMSATPIPRSLSLIIYGDLDLSVLDELPPGRQTVETTVVRRRDMARVYEFMRGEIDSGGRAYVVCPLVEDSDNSDRKAAESYFDELVRGPFKGIPCGLIHGRMKPKEKEKAMADFAAGLTKILVSTTVIEVGVDVPEATVMLVENAESFGLSQLHQLRGRIGRGERRSYCVLVNGGGGDDASDRLAILRSTSDGFEVAEADLRRRGPGDFFGERQSGDFSSAFAAMNDMSLITETDRIVREVNSRRGAPEYRPMIEAAESFLKRTGGAKTLN